SQPEIQLPAPVLKQIKRISDLETDLDIEFIIQDSPELIQDSLEGTERIKKIVLGLKDFARPEEQGLQPVDINKSINSTLDVVWNKIKDKAAVTKDFGALPLVRIYAQDLNQVFMNILLNAADAIEDRGEIKIVTRALNEYVEVIISDTGAGIPEENLSKIFDPFFTTKKIGAGEGLGLNFAYNIIQKCNGTIDVQSAVGQGTAFTIRIPVRPVTDDD
ncbi:MAG: ATP-binding protein, partial [Thermodesulfobacteriota bacterium]|nr:ATP-binding protein [Thermodesulfobacteriota bacterium]